MCGKWEDDERWFGGIFSFMSHSLLPQLFGRPRVLPVTARCARSRKQRRTPCRVPSSNVCARPCPSPHPPAPARYHKYSVCRRHGHEENRRPAPLAPVPMPCRCRVAAAITRTPARVLNTAGAAPSIASTRHRCCCFGTAADGAPYPAALPPCPCPRAASAMMAGLIPAQTPLPILPIPA